MVPILKLKYTNYKSKERFQLKRYSQSDLMYDMIITRLVMFCYPPDPIKSNLTTQMLRTKI